MPIWGEATKHASFAIMQLILRIRTSEVRPPKECGVPPAATTDFVRTDAEPDANEIVLLSCAQSESRFFADTLMGHSSQFGRLYRTPPWRRELRIAMSCLLFGGIAGALCVSGVAPRPSDRAAMKVAEAPPAMASQEAASQEVGNDIIPRTDARAASSEGHAGTAARPQASADVSVRKSSETSAPDVAPQSAIAPKPRTVRIRKAVDSPAIARLPLGRSEAPAVASLPGDAHQPTQASQAGTDIPAVAPEKNVA